MLTCPTCNAPLTITPSRPGFGRATCPQCGGRFPVVIHKDIDGELSAAFKAKRPPLADVKKRRGLRMYDWQIARCEAAGKKPQQMLDEAVERLPPAGYKSRLQISLSSIECPECHGHNCVKYNGVFCGVIYGCADCLNSFPSPFCECKLPGWAADNPSVCPTCKKPRRVAEGKNTKSAP